MLSVLGTMSGNPTRLQRFDDVIKGLRRIDVAAVFPEGVSVRLMRCHDR